MFSAGEVASLRLESERAMVDTAHVRTVATTADEGGGLAEGAPTTIQVPCRVGSVSRADEREIAAKLEAIADSVLVVPLSAAHIPLDSSITVAFARGGIGVYQVAGYVPVSTHAIDRRYLLKQGVT